MIRETQKPHTIFEKQLNCPKIIDLEHKTLFDKRVYCFELVKTHLLLFRLIKDDFLGSTLQILLGFNVNTHTQTLRLTLEHLKTEEKHCFKEESHFV